MDSQFQFGGDGEKWSEEENQQQQQKITWTISKNGNLFLRHRSSYQTIHYVKKTFASAKKLSLLIKIFESLQHKEEEEFILL